MPHQEEPESQVEPPPHGFIDDMDFPPRVVRTAEVQQEQSIAEECTEGCIRDATLEDTSAASLFESPRRNNSMSLVEETQFVDVELDTQGTDAYDISPTTRRAMDNMVLAPTAEAPPIMQTAFLERKPVGSPDVSSFRFGVPPKVDSLKMNRPLPGKPASAKHQEVSTLKSLDTVTRDCPPRVNFPPMATPSLPRRGKLPISLSDDNEEQVIHIADASKKNGSIPDIISATCFKEAGHVPVPDAEQDTIEVFSNAKTNLEQIPSRKQGTMGPPFQEVTGSLPNLMESRHLPLVSLSNDSFDHTSHPQHNSGLSTTNVSDQPPSNDHVIIRAVEDPEVETRTHDTTPRSVERQRRYPKPQNNQKPETKAAVLSELVGAANSAVKKLIETFGEGTLSSIAHSEGDTRIRETQHQTIPNHSHDQAIHTVAPPGDTFQRSGSPLGSPDQNCSSSNGVKGNGSRLPKRDSTKLPVNRPLQSSDLQPDSADQGNDLQATRRLKVTKKTSSRTKESPNNQVTRSVLPTTRGAISSVEMLQMVAVMANAERERLEDVSTTNRILEEQIRSRNEEEIVLREYVRKLEFDNENLMGSVANFDQRARAFKDHCNEVVRAQKQLRKSADEWHQQKPHILKQIKQEVDAIRNAAEEHTQKALETFSGKTTETLKEARLKVDSQEQTIEVLKGDLNNRLLDLQRERRVAESLRKQLDENCAQHEQIKNLLLQQHANTASNLDVQQAQIAHGLDTAAEQRVRMDECLLLMSGIKDSEAKTLPALEGLSSLVVSLSTTVEDRLQTAEDRATSVRKAGEEVLAELSVRLSNMSEDREAQQQMNRRIESLLEDNATLKERVLGRERECTTTTSRLDKTLQELETCRDQLISMTEKLSNTLATPPEDPVLRGQFLDLQDKYSILNDQFITTVKEAENANATLRAKDDSSRLIQEQITELQLKLQQSEAKIIGFETEKEAYGQKKDRDSKVLRIQMERDFQARLSDDDARHSGIVSSLRRQICDYEGKAVQLQRELDVAQQMSSNNTSVAGKLRADIADLEIRTSQQTVELTRMDDELRSKGEDGVSAAAELCLARERIVRYEKEIDEWRAKAESNASQYAKRCYESDERIKNSDAIAKKEISALKQELDELRRRAQIDDALKVAVMKSLQELGIVGHARCLEDFVLNAKNTCLRKRRVAEDNNVLENGRSFSQPNSPSQEASFYFNTLPTNVRSFPRTEGQSSRESADMLFPATINTTYSCSEVNDDEDPLPDMVRSSSPAVNRNEDKNRKITSTNSGGELHLSGSTTAIDCQPTATRRRLEDAFAQFPTEYDRRYQLRTTSESGSDGTFLSGIAPSLDPSTKTVIPDSQEEMAQNEKPQITRPVRRVAERKASIVASPRTQEANRTVSRTKVTEYSVKMSKTYEASPTVRQERSGIMASGKPTSIVRSAVTGGSSSSPLSSPPSDFDFSEYLEEPEKEEPLNDNKGQQTIEDTQEIVGNSYLKDNAPLACGSREVTRAREMLPLKSILKRTKSISQSTGVVYQAHASRTQSVADLRHPKVPNILNKSGGKKRLPHPSVNGTGPPYNPYNRIVSGTKDADKVSQLETRHHQDLGPMSPTSDVYTIDSSPVQAPPLGNARKRSRSSVESDDHRNPTKLQRLNRF